VIDMVSNFMEHPNLVAQRVCQLAGVVGRERIIAGTDCGFGTFAGFDAVRPEIAYVTLRAPGDGEAVAPERVWS
jgi:5-methyltetrahydropteroyltriglutamate--homocysteine methyltransferase